MHHNLKLFLSRICFGVPGLVAIVIFAAVIRVAWSLLIPVAPVSDGVAYSTFAQNLLLHGTFGWEPQSPTAFWPPGTTFLHVAALYLLGNSPLSLVALNILVSLGVVVVGARIAHRCFGARVAVVTALLLSIWPTLIMYSTVLASEMIFLLFSLIALDCWRVEHRKRAFGLAVVAGLALGFASLVRPQALLLPFIFAAGHLLVDRASRSSLRQQISFAVIVTTVMLLVVAPWTLRNHLVFSEFVPVSTNGGVTLWMGNAPGTDGQYLDIPPHYAALPEVERSRAMGAEAKRIILDDPFAFVQRAAVKAFRLYGNESIGVVWNERGVSDVLGQGWLGPMKNAARAFWYVLLLFAVIGAYDLVLGRGIRAGVGLPVVLMILYFTAIHMVVKAQDRYHLAFAAQIAMLSALGILRVVERFSSRGLRLGRR